MACPVVGPAMVVDATLVVGPTASVMFCGFGQLSSPMCSLDRLLEPGTEGHDRCAHADTRTWWQSSAEAEAMAVRRVVTTNGFAILVGSSSRATSAVRSSPAEPDRKRCSE